MRELVEVKTSHDHESDEGDVVVDPGDRVFDLATLTEHPHHEQSVGTVGDTDTHSGIVHIPSYSDATAGVDPARERSTID